MRLGRFAQLSVAVPELARALPFFERLGFEKLDQSLEPWPWAVISDGTISINLTETTPGPAALSYFASDMAERVKSVEGLGVRLTRVQQREIPELLAVLETPAGVGVSLLEYPARRIPRPSGLPTCRCGTFAELALPVPDLEDSLDFWTRVGFEQQLGSARPYPWAVISDGLMSLGLYQTRDFEQAALVYSSADTGDRVEELTQDGFEFAGEIPSPGRGISRTVLPAIDGQLLIFLE
jgi:catechol 2,3-dioxygenase-like lactoylglutathione lyase family enzyme